MSFFASTANTSNVTSQITQGDLSGDIELSSPPEDGISDLSFSPQAELLAVSSWDKKVRIYEISPTGSSIGKAAYEHDAPVLSVSWSKVCFPDTPRLVECVY
jgi:mRNA export factor